MGFDGDLMLLVQPSTNSLQRGTGLIIPSSIIPIMALREFNDSKLEVDVFNGISRSVTSITSDSIASYLGQQNFSDLNGAYNLNGEYIQPFAVGVITIPIAVILALLAVTVIMVHWVVITGSSPIVGNGDVRRELESLGSSAIEAGRSLVNAVSDS